MVGEIVSENKYDRALRWMFIHFGANWSARIKTVVSIVLHPVIKARNVSKLNCYMRRTYSNDHFRGIDNKVWYRIFLKMILSSNEERFVEMIGEFYDNPLELVKDRKTTKTDPVLVCVLKNDIYRLPEFYKHYRDIGVENFIIIDNGSTDGSLEYLIGQDDTQVFRTTKTYNSIRKTAWGNRAIAYNGLGRWYLIPDSDELFVFPEMERMRLPQYVQSLNRNCQNAVKAMMLEMYPKGKLFDENSEPSQFRKYYRFFDGDINRYFYDPVYKRVYGGFHERVFEGIEREYRNKVPLIYYDGKNIEVGSHEIFPYERMLNARIGSILLHYKFLPNERNKISEIANNGTYANNSRLYRKYENRFSSEEDFNPFFEGSREWIGVESFDNFDFIEKVSEIN